MTAKFFEDNITADGTYAFPVGTPAIDQVVELSGSFGGGTATLGYVSGSGAFKAYVGGSGDDITTTGEQSWIVTLPPSGRLAVYLTGSTTPVIKLTATNKR